MKKAKQTEITVTQAAKLAGLTRQGVHIAIQRGDLTARIEAFGVSTRKLIPKAQFDKWLEARKNGTVRPGPKGPHKPKVKKPEKKVIDPRIIALRTLGRLTVERRPAGRKPAGV